MPSARLIAAALAVAAPDLPAAERPPQLGLCVACHHDEGRGGPPGTPRLAGQDEAYLRAALEAYRSGERRHAPMRAIVGALGADDVAALARWYARQPVCPP